MHFIYFNDLTLCNTLLSDKINVIVEVEEESEHRSLTCTFKFYVMYEELISLLFSFLGVQSHAF